MMFKFFFCILSVNGDSEGQDKQCGKIVSKGKYPSVYQCRLCNITYDNLDNPHTKVKYISQTKIAELVNTALDPLS
jgi:hypothetical protein